ncbi:hypothetical protein D3C78_1503580 [compost metagenome]
MRFAGARVAHQDQAAARGQVGFELCGIALAARFSLLLAFAVRRVAVEGLVLEALGNQRITELVGQVHALTLDVFSLIFGDLRRLAAWARRAEGVAEHLVRGCFIRAMLFAHGHGCDLRAGDAGQVDNFFRTHTSHPPVE